MRTCFVCGVRTNGRPWLYKSYILTNTKYCPSCQYAIELYNASYYRSERQKLVDYKDKLLSELSDEDFVEKVTKKILKGEEVEV